MSTTIVTNTVPLTWTTPADVAMLTDALAALIAIVDVSLSGLSADDWAALEDARRAIAQAGRPNAEVTGAAGLPDGSG